MTVSVLHTSKVNDWSSIPSTAAMGNEQSCGQFHRRKSNTLISISRSLLVQRTSGASASLMLTLEAVFTALLARLWTARHLIDA